MDAGEGFVAADDGGDVAVSYTQEQVRRTLMDQFRKTRQQVKNRQVSEGLDPSSYWRQVESYLPGMEEEVDGSPSPEAE